MGRYSFSPPAHQSVKVSETSWREYKDDISSSDDSDSESSMDSYTNSSDDEEKEFPHPLGFPSFGKTRFFLDPPVESAEKVRRRLGFLQQNQADFLQPDGDQHEPMQSFPPLSSYTDAKTAPSRALLSLSHYENEHPQEDDLLLDGVTQLLQAAKIVNDDCPQYQRLLSETRQAGQQLLQMSQTMERDLQSARQEALLKRQELEKQHQETHAAFMVLLKRDEQAAEKVLKQQEAEERAQEEANQLKRDKEEKDQAERRRVADERQKKEREKQLQTLEAAQKRDKEQKAAAEEEAKKTEYIAKAKKRVAQLVDVRASVAPFEKSKNVSRRRLKMKKSVKGKLNTLSQDAHKIQTVATEVAQAIQEAREEDEQLKQQIRAGNRDITEEMIRGKRYLVDLLASDTMVRAQAEGFNGTRGDGFPLANMLAMISTECKELLPILAAHIYTVCPTAIPALPKVTKDESEDELMESLGMTKGKDGQYETFDRFLARTEGIISLVADIMASNPPDHLLMGGHEGATIWLDRFLEQLPGSPETMPLLTAPVLDAFLTGAGHMLANIYPEEFKKQLDTIMNDVVNRLDEGTIGAPSALRLKKLVKGGFDSFKTDFPPKAIPSLYNAGSSSGSAQSSFGQSVTTTAQPTSGSSMSTTTPNPFGGGQHQQQASSGPFSSAGSDTSSISNPFGAPSALGASGSSSFVTSNKGFAPAVAVPAPQTPFGAPAPASSFGQSASLTSQAATSGFGGGGGFGQPASTGGMNASPFGQPSTNTGFGNQSQLSMQTSSNASPFGQPTTSTAKPFGAQNQSTSMQQSTFGVASSTSSPFGQPSNPSPFGSQNQSNLQASNPPPFGQSRSTSGFGQSSSTSGFGGGQNQAFGMNAAKSPFGNVSNPFGAPTGQASAGGFGSSSNPTPFGNNQSKPFGGTQQSTSLGGTQQSTPFGGTQQSTSFGGTQQSTPFGGTQQSTPFGGTQQSTPFGGTQQSTPFGGSQSTPFGGSSQTPFGGTSSQMTPFGGNQQNASWGNGVGNQNSGNKPPCKFFAQGKCRFGDSCRFSHDMGGNAGAYGGGYSNNPFGGPRR